MELRDLIEALPGREVLSLRQAEVRGIAYDSRRVRPGDLFVAVPGFHADGHTFIPEAVEQGAVAVVAQKGYALPLPSLSVPLCLVPESRRALALLSAAFFDYPGRKMRVIGVTGTDGKTTTTYLISALLEAAGYRTGLLGTVDFKVGDRLWANESRQTTPEAPEIQQLLAEMVAAQTQYAIVESTSHGLALERVTGCEYDVAVVTNVTRDHLDFHGTWEEYLAAKARLFSMLGEAVNKGIPKVSVLNIDDSSYQPLRPYAHGEVVTYGVHTPALVQALEVVLSGLGSRFTLVTPWGHGEVTTGLPGMYNVYNALAAASVALSQGVEFAVVQRALGTVPGVPGRMERIQEGQPFSIIVDYAHTPDSFQKVLETLRPLIPGRVLVVFGCAGERDRERRFGMGRVAGRLADFAVLTNEDPRSEDPEVILEDIAQGIREIRGRRTRRYVKIPDRREAIRFAFRRAREGDLVLLAGKGHEQSIIVGDRKLPWDDRRVAREVVRELR